MEAFDLVRTDVEAAFAERLGFKEILPFRSIKNSTRIGMSSDANILQKVRSGGVGVISEDYSIDGKLIAEMKANGTALYISLGRIINSYGLRRSRNIYLARRMFRYAKRKRLSMGFVTLADSDGQMCSAIQMLSLAKLIGADENVARSSLEKVNSLLLKCKDIK